MSRKVVPLKRSFTSTKMDIFAQYRIEDVPVICEHGTPAPVTEVCAIIPSTLYRDRTDIAGSVFNLPRLIKFVENNEQIFEMKNAMTAMRTVADRTPDGAEQMARFFTKRGILAIDAPQGTSGAPVSRIDS